MWTIVLAAAGVILLFILSTRLRSPRVLPIVGSEAPEFTLRSQDGTPVRLNDFRGKWVILYFYPKDSTPGCTIEARKFQHDEAEYIKGTHDILPIISTFQRRSLFSALATRLKAARSTFSGRCIGKVGSFSS